jgi:hypothetical protein
MTGSLGLAALLALLAPSFNVYTTSAGKLAHWEPCRVPWVLGDDAPEYLPAAEVLAATRAAFDAWGGIACAPLDLEFAGYAAGMLHDPGDGRSGVAWISQPDQWTHGLTAYAYTTLTLSTSRGAILDADLELNVANWRAALGDSCTSGAWDLSNVVTHEAGHFIGLDHSDQPLASMYPHAAPCDTFMRSLSEDDVAGYCAIYLQQPCTPAGDAEAVPEGAFETGADTATGTDALGGAESDPEPGPGGDCSAGRSRPGLAAWALMSLMFFGLSALRRGWSPRRR